ncbi:hypothetical protein CKO27_09380 [Thiocystis violacea]|nr:hypothetical protein [Thiocystis violacea]
MLTPCYYHGRYAMDGSASDPDVITDTALLFALRATLLGAPATLKARPDYRADLMDIPWRASLLMGQGNALLPPLRRSVDMEREGGRSVSVQSNMNKGHYKNIFFTHSIAAGATYRGLLVGPDPFAWTDSGSLIVRVGVGRAGMLRLARDDGGKEVRLNAATGLLFNRSLTEQERRLDTIRPTAPMSVEKAAEELRQWLN